MATRKLVIDVIVDESGQAVSKLRDIDRTTKGLGERFASFGRSAQGVGLALSAGLTLPIAAAGRSILQLGMNAAESEDLFGRAFGGMANQARAWSEEVAAATAASSFGLREQSAIMFSMAESFGLGQQAAFDLSTGVSELGQDFESLFNLAEGEGFSKLRSGLIGEIEPLRSIGISFTAADVAARAYEAGIASVGEELTEGQKVLARWALILDQSSLAQGNAADTADSEANALRDLKTEIADSARALGISLLPVVGEFLTVARALIPAIESTVRWFSELPDWVRSSSLVIGGLVAVIGPVIAILGTLTLGVTAFVGAVGAPLAAAIAGAIAAIGAIGAAIASVVVIWNNFGDVVPKVVADTVTAIRTWLVDRLGGIVTSVGEKVGAVTGFFSNMFEAVVGGSFVPDMVRGIGDHFGQLGDVMVNPAKFATDAVSGLFDSWTSGLMDKLGGVFGEGGMMSGLLSSGLSALTSVFTGGLGGLIGGGIKAIGNFFKNLGGPDEAELAGRDAWRTYSDGLAKSANSEQIQQALGAGWANVNDATAWIVIRDAVSQAGGTAAEAEQLWQRYVDAIKQGPEAIAAVTQEIDAWRAIATDSVAEINSELDTLSKPRKINIDFNVNRPDMDFDFGGGFGELQEFQRGGIVRGAGAVPIMAHGGEGVLTPTGLRGVGGASGLRALNRGGGLGGGSFNLTVNVTGNVHDPAAARKLANIVNRETVKQMQRQGFA